MRQNHVRIERELAQNIASTRAMSRKSCEYTAVHRCWFFCYSRIAGVESLAMGVGGKLKSVVRGGKGLSSALKGLSRFLLKELDVSRSRGVV